jgi:hypothetical protein
MEQAWTLDQIGPIDLRHLILTQPTHVGQQCTVQIDSMPPIQVRLVAGLLDGALAWHPVGIRSDAVLPWEDR